MHRSSMIITVPFFAIAFLLLGMHQSSPTEYQSDWSPSPSEVPSPTGCLRRTGYLRRTGTQSDWVPQKDWDPVGLSTSEGLGPSRIGYLRRTGTQSDWVTSHDWNWCIATSRVFETRIFLSSNFKKMRKSRFYWWSSFVYLFMIEVLNDFALLKRIYVFWSKGDPVEPVTQSPSRGLELVHPYSGVALSSPSWGSYDTFKTKNDIEEKSVQSGEVTRINKWTLADRTVIIIE